MFYIKHFNALSIWYDMIWYDLNCVFFPLKSIVWFNLAVYCKVISELVQEKDLGKFISRTGRRAPPLGLLWYNGLLDRKWRPPSPSTFFQCCLAIMRNLNHRDADLGRSEGQTGLEHLWAQANWKERFADGTVTIETGESIRSQSFRSGVDPLSTLQWF